MPAGRPTKYNDELAAEICTRLSNGKSLRSICKMKDMPSPESVRLWLIKYPEFMAQYALAREEQADSIFDECLDIVDKKTMTPEEIQHARLRVDTRKWMAGKLRPKKYAEKLDVEHGGKVTVNIDGKDKDLL